jgi:hypothetical protein
MSEPTAQSLPPFIIGRNQLRLEHPTARLLTVPMFSITIPWHNQNAQVEGFFTTKTQRF